MFVSFSSNYIDPGGLCFFRVHRLQNHEQHEIVVNGSCISTLVSSHALLSSSPANTVAIDAGVLARMDMGDDSGVIINTQCFWLYIGLLCFDG